MLTMKVVFLGTMGYYPTEENHTCSVLIKDLNIILDAGTGFFRFPKYIQPEELNILLSHFHLDHIVGLTWLYELFKGKKVNIYSSKDVKEILSTIFSNPFFAIPFSKHPFSFEFKEVGEGSFNINGANVSSKIFPHSYPVLGYRIEYNGKIITYITDTKVSEEEINFIRNSDLLIHECYYPKELEERANREGHSITTEVARLAKKAGCKKLALYHLNPVLKDSRLIYEKEAKEIFPNSFIAEDLMEIEI